MFCIGTCQQPPSSIIRTTHLHQDHFLDTGKPLRIQDVKVGFVFLEDNEDALFIHGNERFSVEMGKFVAFDGRLFSPPKLMFA